MGIYLVRCETKKGKNVYFKVTDKTVKVSLSMTSHTTTRIYAHTSIFDNFIKPMKYHPLLNSNDYKNNYILLAWSYLVTIKRGVVVTLLFKFWIKFTTIAINWSKVNADSNIKSTLLILIKDKFSNYLLCVIWIQEFISYKILLNHSWNIKRFL